MPAGDKIASGKKMDNELSNQTGCHKLEFLNILNAPTPFFLVTWLSTDFTDAHHQYPHMCVCVCGGCTLILVYIHRLGHYLGSKNVISIFLEVFRKINIFGCVILLDIFGGHRSIGLHVFVWVMLRSF